MKWAIWIFAAALLSGTAALGDSNNVMGGALIAHYPSQITYSTDPPACGNWCCAYEPYAISSIAEENVRIDASDDPVIWYVLAAWQEDKIFCAAEFGLGNYTAANFAVIEYSPCFPSEAGGLELPTAGWPGPNEGTAFTRSGEVPWSGNWLPIYYFAGYAYGGVEMIPIDVDPVTDFAGFSNCDQNPQLGEVVAERRGAMGINMEGIKVGPSEDPEMVCCVTPLTGPPECHIATEQACLDMGGTWRPDLGSSCVGNPCDPVRACCWTNSLLQRVCSELTETDCMALTSFGVPTWLENIESCTPNPCNEAACCVGEACTIETELDCDALGGEFIPGVMSCDPNPCDLGACCFDEEPYCTYVYEHECLAAHPEIQEFTPGQIWHPSGNCDPGNPWCYPSPVEESTWGRIKRLYQ